MDLEELQKQFLSLQQEAIDSTLHVETPNTSTLSNAVPKKIHVTNSVAIEMVSYLSKLNPQFQLLYTIDRKQFLTFEKLEEELSQYFTTKAKGRVNLDQLEEDFQIDKFFFEKLLQQSSFLKQHDAILLPNQTIVSKQYWEMLAVEIEELLKISGMLTLEAISKKYDVPLTVVLQQLVPLLRPKAQQQDHSMYYVENQCIFTRDFVQRERVRLRGMCNAIRKPIFIADRKSLFHESLFEPLFKELIKSKQIRGILRKGGMYYPDSYLSQLKEKVVESFLHNGTLLFDQLDELVENRKDVLSKKEYILQHVSSDAICLEKGAVSQEFIHRLDELIHHSSETQIPFIELLGSLFPSRFDKEDIMTVLEHHCPHFKATKEEWILFCHSFLLAKRVVPTVLQNYVPILKQALKQSIKKPRKKKEGSKRSASLDGESQQDEFIEQSIIQDALPNEKELWQFIKKQLDSLSKNSILMTAEEEDIKEEIVQYFYSLIVKQSKDILDSIINQSGSTTATSQKSSQLSLEEQRNQIHYELLQITKTLELLSKQTFQDSCISSLIQCTEDYLIDSHCRPLHHCIVKEQAITKVILSSKEAESFRTLETLDFKKFPKVIATALTRLKSTLEVRQFAQFWTALKQCSLDCNIVFQVLDKKAARQYISDKRNELAKRLEANVDTFQKDLEQILFLALTFLVAKRKNGLFVTSRAAIPYLIEYCNKDLLKEQPEVLELVNKAFEGVGKYKTNSEQGEEVDLKLILQDLKIKILESD